MKAMNMYSTRIVLMALVMSLFASVAFSADPTDEAKNKESCTGTCSTCPGKASAIMDMADISKVLIGVGSIENAGVVKQIRESLSELPGVEACVPFLDMNYVWVAFDASLVKSAEFETALTELGMKDINEVQSISPLGSVPKTHERIAVYAMMPDDAENLAKAIALVLEITGVSNAVYDNAFNLLLVDFDIAKTDSEKVKNAIVAEGYAAGLPGEDMLQPEV